MAKSSGDQSAPGLFVPTTNIWDVAQIYDVDVNSDQFRELLVRLYQNINNITLALNVKDTGIYPNEEILNGQAFFPNPDYEESQSVTPVYRSVFRTVVMCGELPNAGVKNTPHYIPVNDGYTFTRIYGCATNTTHNSFIPLPFSSPTLNQNIKIEVDDVNVIITTGIDRTSYTTCYVILEYLKS